MSTHDAAPVVVLTALDLEYTAVRKHLVDLKVHRKEGTRFERGSLPDGTEIALALIGEGNLGAATLAERARAAFAPLALLMTGVAGALKDDLNLGDIVVATKIYAYHGAKEQGGEQLLRPSAWETDHELLQTAHHVSRTEAWTRYLPADSRLRPEVHFKPIAAGEVVLNSRDTPLARQLHHNFNDAAAIEMESAGIAKAGGLSRSMPVLSIRGISDKADGAKHSADQEGWQPAAAANAAAFTLALAAEVHAMDSEDARPQQPEAGKPGSVHQTVTAQGDAFVAGGNIYFHDVPPGERRGPF